LQTSALRDAPATWAVTNWVDQRLAIVLLADVKGMAHQHEPAQYQRLDRSQTIKCVGYSLCTQYCVLVEQNPTQANKK
jgi:hypothetical protein